MRFIFGFNEVLACINFYLVNKNVETFNSIISSLKSSSLKAVLGKDNIDAFGNKLKDLKFDQLKNTLIIKNSVLTIPQMSITSSALLTIPPMPFTDHIAKTINKAIISGKKASVPGIFMVSSIPTKPETTAIIFNIFIPNI